MAQREDEITDQKDIDVREQYNITSFSEGSFSHTLWPNCIYVLVLVLESVRIILFIPYISLPSKQTNINPMISFYVTQFSYVVSLYVSID